MIRDNLRSYGWVSIAIHWLTALAVIGLFALGYWMLTLSYYDPWYRLGPWWHKSIGLLLLGLSILRLLWRWLNPSPVIEGSRFERVGAKLGHVMLYALLFVVMISGYLISTADGRAISVFDWFSIPATITTIEQQEELAGDIHWYAALSLIILSGGHALMALKHHYLDKHDTLKRMLKPQPKS
ncbi:MAG: cytochrome b [Idiomarina sp.]